MLSKLEAAKEKWGGAHQLIDSWLSERNELLVRYFQLAGLPPYERADNALPDVQEIKVFCEILVDYISAGHFEVYDKVAAQSSGTEGAEDLANELLPKITASTDSALSFNDAYAVLEDDTGLNRFDLDLAELGQKMEERFAYEDRLINMLHEKHIDALDELS